MKRCFTLLTALVPAAILACSVSPAALAAKKPAPKASRLSKPSQPAIAGPAKAVPLPLTPGALVITQGFVREGAATTPSGSLTLKSLPATARWLRNSHRDGFDAPLFPAGPLSAADAAWKPSAKGTKLPETTAVAESGVVRREPARWLTVASGATAFTFPVSPLETAPSVRITPQKPGNVVPLNGPLPLAVSFSNPSASARTWNASVRAVTASGSVVSTTSFPITVPALSRVTTPVAAGPIKVTGYVSVTVAASEKGQTVASASTGGGAVAVSKAVRSSEYPFGMTGGDLEMAAAAGAQFWVSGWPWWNADLAAVPVGEKIDPSPGSAEGIFAVADRLGVALISRVDPGSEESRARFSRAAMERFKRRSGGWTLPYEATTVPVDYAGRMSEFYATSKAIHKDAPTFVEVPAAVDGGIEIGRGLAETGGERNAEVLAFRGLGVAPGAEGFDASLRGILDLRDAAYPGREIWNLGEETASPAKASAIEQAGMVTRSTVEQIAAGIDKVFWSAESDILMRSDGSAAPGFFGLATLSQTLGGSEYVGPMPWSDPVRGEVFQKNGEAILVAWCISPLPQQVTLPLLAPRSLEARDVMNTTANLAYLSGNKLTVRKIPVIVRNLGPSLLPQAMTAARALRLAEMRKAYEALDLAVGDDFPASLSNEAGAEWMKKALDAYRPDEERRARTLTAVYALLKLWDSDVLKRSAGDKTTALAHANNALNAANRAQADLRSEIDRNEGMTRYQQDMRILLTLVEKRLYQARAGLRQKDLALARAHAEQMAASARTLIPYVKAWPVVRDAPRVAMKTRTGGDDGPE